MYPEYIMKSSLRNARALMSYDIIEREMKNLT